MTEIYRYCVGWLFLFYGVVILYHLLHGDDDDRKEGERKNCGFGENKFFFLSLSSWNEDITDFHLRNEKGTTEGEAEGDTVTKLWTTTKMFRQK